MDIVVDRTLDIGLCLSILAEPEIWETISEDTATIDNNIPDVINDMWLAIYADKKVIGVCHLHQKYLNTVQAHIQILKRHREFSISAGECIIKWIKTNTEYKNIYTEVPSLYSNVIAFLKNYNFKEVGEIKDCYTKEQKTYNTYIYQKVL